MRFTVVLYFHIRVFDIADRHQSCSSFPGEDSTDRRQVGGSAALVRALNVQAPVRHPSVISEQYIRGSRRQEAEWSVFDKRYWPGADFAAHLSFAFRHEPMDLLIMKRVFEAVSADVVQEFVRSAPTGVSSRRAWILYELLTGRTLDIPELPATLAAIDLLDPEAYFTGTR